MLAVHFQETLFFITPFLVKPEMDNLLLMRRGCLSLPNRVSSRPREVEVKIKVSSWCLIEGVHGGLDKESLKRVSVENPLDANKETYYSINQRSIFKQRLRKEILSIIQRDQEMRKRVAIGGGPDRSQRLPSRQR